SCSIDNQAGLIRLRKDGSRSTLPLDAIVVPFRESGDKLIVDAELNGRRTDMCFDTGAFGVCISKEQCRKIGIKIPETASVSTKGPNGRLVDGWEITADVFLGPIKKRDCPVRVIDSEMSYPLLGQNFFADRVFSIDRVGKEIRFAR
ncbi:MAG: retroviral-like aspartic protease family protein, partial [Candidatus Obscuribacterales bacterium]|nr:retroviral-like aspartic protease family protein [Candidatus Obscuribacterales bacterium]